MEKKRQLQKKNENKKRNKKTSIQMISLNKCGWTGWEVSQKIRKEQKKINREVEQDEWKHLSQREEGFC